jgi:UDPglucose 6-dehydrogenase
MTPPVTEPGAIVAVIGAGYVGLTEAVCLAHRGNQVCCGEVDPAKVERLSRGECTIVEQNLPDLLRQGLETGRLRFVLTAAAAVRDAEFVFLCVPTPERPDGSADTTALESVALEIGPHLAPEAIVVNKSTVPLGSTVLVKQLLDREDITVVSNPEFTREGSAVHDLLHPDRVVVGSNDKIAAARVAALLTGDAPVILTDPATAELIKYASNAVLATKLSFVNSVASMCEALGADVDDVLLGIGYDHRIGSEYLRPGPGWGGSCLPKDTRALSFMARSAGFDFSLLEEVIRTNERQIASIVAKVRRALGGSLLGATVGAWGLTFKAGTDDLRDSPAMEIVRQLIADGAKVKAFEPTRIGRDVPELCGSVEMCDDAYCACDGADALIVLAEWEEFRSVDFTKVRDLMTEPLVIDARNLLNPTTMRSLGFLYIGIGRPSMTAS